MVPVRHNRRGVAIGLGENVAPPAQRWIDDECKRTGIDDPEVVMIPAKAREIWAAAYGDRAAENLSFYAADWKVKDLRLVTARQMVEYLRFFNRVIWNLSFAAVA